MKSLFLALLFLGIGWFGFSQSKSQFYGTWDIISISFDGIINLKKSYENKKYKTQNSYFKFESSGGFSTGPVFQRCGSNTGGRIKSLRTWIWDNELKQIITYSKLGSDKIKTYYKVIKSTNKLLTLKRLKAT